MARKVADCRGFPSEKPCTLTIAGEEEEVMRAAVEHAVSYHGDKDTPELRGEIRKSLKNEAPEPKGSPSRGEAKPLETPSGGRS